MRRVEITPGFPGLDRIPRDTSPGIYPVEARAAVGALRTLGWDAVYATGEHRHVDAGDGACWLPLLRFGEETRARVAADVMTRLVDAVGDGREVIHLEYHRRTDGGTEKLRASGSAADLKGLLRTVAAEDAD
ncbi:hypothetical protein [Phytomonospora endophytica]|uniref:Uncharacterized protein n=1 Tax=Phytomonospora endophytica TaxID=714109 RepID=A0A841G3W2_9ACTN|nr:hypothetical protein [Phytomonospora endophytica]MBB6038800.1 hypothetical protein [Phytomonospora endophytica]GIG68404.1 hypothetical protein Pen01_46990 [Phytomonospora endophytica]